MWFNLVFAYHLKFVFVRPLLCFCYAFVFKFIFVRPRFGRSWHRGWRRPNSRAKSAGCILLATPYDAANFALNLESCIFCICALYLHFILCLCFVFVTCVCAIYFLFVLLYLLVWFMYLHQILGARLGNKGGVTLAAIRIRTFGNICIWDFTAHDKSVDYRKIAALPRNQAHLHGYKCKVYWKLDCGVT